MCCVSIMSGVRSAKVTSLTLPGSHPTAAYGHAGVCAVCAVCVLYHLNCDSTCMHANMWGTTWLDSTFYAHCHYVLETRLQNVFCTVVEWHIRSRGSVSDLMSIDPYNVCVFCYPFFLYTVCAVITVLCLNTSDAQLTAKVSWHVVIHICMYTNTSHGGIEMRSSLSVTCMHLWILCCCMFCNDIQFKLRSHVLK